MVEKWLKYLMEHMMKPKVSVNGLVQRDSRHGLGARRGPVHALYFVLCIRW